MAEKKVKRVNSSVLVIGVVVVVLIVLGVYYYMNSAPIVPVVEEEVPVVFGKVINMQILDYTFLPKSLTIKVGDSVNWTNRDVPSHSVVSNAGAFESLVLYKGQSFVQIFTQPGTYEYHCGLHPGMKAKIIVE